ncbi:DNA translocase FtsK [uncultured Traorella sp.]|uniref:FtsK/SpoIIIE family DNA translocase n=1 Tax=uncultured Traorella sp. TaxID=1929048 RepID=UPI0025F84DC4|nr:DNA translocase FtsK [uncultured Traorella sp.]
MTKQKNAKKTTNKKMDNEILTVIYAFLAIALSIIGILEIGPAGIALGRVMYFLVGMLGNVVFAFVILIAILVLFKKNLSQIRMRSMIGLICFFAAWLLLVAAPDDHSIVGMDVIHLFLANVKEIFNDTLIASIGNGGILGAFLYALFSALFDFTGTRIMIIMFLLIGIIMFWDYLKIVFGFFFEKVQKTKEKSDSRKEKKKREKQLFEDDYEDIIDYEKPQGRFDFENLVADKVSEGDHQEKSVIDIQADPIKEEKKEPEIESSFLTDYSKYRLPGLNLLNLAGKGSVSANNKKAAAEAGEKLLQILDEFGVKATLVDTHIGPSVTKFELKPDLGVKVSKISNLQNDIKLALAAKDIRIEAPIPSKSAVGIEIPNVDKTIVNLRELLRSIPSKYENSKLLFALGKDLLGQPVYGELNKMPHLLIAGATGSGKSVCVNSIIISLIMRARPDEVKLLLIDPKKVEFTAYQNIPHLIGPIIHDGDEANTALKVIVEEMDRRYDLFSKAGVRNIAGYNEKCDQYPEEGHTKLPWIVVIIDELADLMLVAAKEVEASIQRITQLARAAGIHLVVATQRPSVDVITGLIKSNIPSRIAFAVSSAVDSRTILDQQGAEKLLGSGDMLYIPIGEQSPIRVQGVYVSDEEVNRVTEFVSKQGRPKFDDAFIRLQMIEDTASAVGMDSNDPLYDEAKQFVISSQKASTSLLQRKFSIGYQRAARLIDMMEENGIVGPSRGSKPREVYMKDPMNEDQM